MTYGRCLQQWMAVNINLAFTYNVLGTVLRILQALPLLTLMILLLKLLINPVYRWGNKKRN